MTDPSSRALWNARNDTSRAAIGAALSRGYVGRNRAPPRSPRRRAPKRTTPVRNFFNFHKIKFLARKVVHTIFLYMFFSRLPS